MIHTVKGKMGGEVKKDEADRSRRLGVPRTMVKADQSL